MRNPPDPFNPSPRNTPSKTLEIVFFRAFTRIPGLSGDGGSKAYARLPVRSEWTNQSFFDIIVIITINLLVIFMIIIIFYLNVIVMYNFIFLMIIMPLWSPTNHDGITRKQVVKETVHLMPSTLSRNAHKRRGER